MSVFSKLVDGLGTLLHTERVGQHVHLVIEQHSRVGTQYKSITHTTAATTTVATPKKGQVMVITDIVVSGEKINGGIITIQWNDGTRQDGIKKYHVTDGPVNLHIGYQGRNKGWKDAFLEFITSTANQDATVEVGYYFIRGAGVQSFDDWDVDRG